MDLAERRKIVDRLPVWQRERSGGDGFRGQRRVREFQAGEFFTICAENSGWNGERQRKQQETGLGHISVYCIRALRELELAEGIEPRPSDYKIQGIPREGVQLQEESVTLSVF